MAWEQLLLWHLYTYLVFLWHRSSRAEVSESFLFSLGKPHFWTGKETLQKYWNWNTCNVPHIQPFQTDKWSKLPHFNRFSSFLQILKTFKNTASSALYWYGQVNINYLQQWHSVCFLVLIAVQIFIIVEWCGYKLHVWVTLGCLAQLKLFQMLEGNRKRFLYA